ncbi:MAG: septal ring lytic transglycosylase RlpA family protein [Kiloniellaceae bacterium]
MAGGLAGALAVVLLLGGCTAETGSRNAAMKSDTRHPPVIATPVPRAAAPRDSRQLATLPEDSPPAETAAPEETVLMSFTGLASWYGKRFHGRLTASGEPYDMTAYTAAHQNLPFGSRVRVTNLDNGRSVVVTINDRGPFVKSRVIDLSRAAARHLGIIGDGVAEVRLDVLEMLEDASG